MQEFYDDNSVLELPSDHLPFGGTYEGSQEIDLFLTKLANSIAYESRQYEIKYLDGRTGALGVLLRLKNGRFRGRALDERKRFFTGDEFVDLMHHIKFDINTNTIASHDIVVQNPAEVFEWSAPLALQHLKKLQTKFYKAKKIDEDSEVMDKIHDDVVLHVHVDPPIFEDDQTVWEGKKGLLEFANLSPFDKDDDEDEEDKDEGKDKTEV